MRTTITALILLGLLLTAVPVHANHETPDGVTAFILPKNLFGVAEQVLVSDGLGHYPIRVDIYQKDGAGWAKVAMDATLRVFVYDASRIDPLAADPEAGWVDAVSIPFRSSTANATTPILVPQSALGAPSLSTPVHVDVFVTFAAPGLGGHTSHLSQAKNQAIRLGQYDLADELDYHGAATHAWAI